MDKHLEHFVAIAEAGSYMAASQALLVSQPALSYNINKLETRLGVKLFDRSSRGVQLTPYGEILYENALMMRRLHANAISSIARKKADLEEGLKIGTGYSTWHLLLRDMVLEEARARPDSPIHVSLGNELRCMEQLLAGEISLFVGHRIDNLAQDNLVRFIPLGEVSASFFVRAGHPLLGAPRNRVEIRAYPSVLVATRDARQERMVHGAGRSYAHVFQDVGHGFVSNSLDVCLDYLRETDGVLYHSRLIRKLLMERDIHKVEMHPGETYSAWLMGIYVNEETASDPRVARIVDYIVARKDRVLDLPSNVLG